jgi:Fe2+ transport system protein B
MIRRACPLTPEQAGRRGVTWIIGSFVLCPCHLPVTLWVAGAVLSGTAGGSLLLGHPYVAGVILGVLWLAGTLYGFSLMRRGRVDAYTRPSAGRFFSE